MYVVAVVAVVDEMMGYVKDISCTMTRGIKMCDNLAGGTFCTTGSQIFHDFDESFNKATFGA